MHHIPFDQLKLTNFSFIRISRRYKNKKSQQKQKWKTSLNVNIYKFINHFKLIIAEFNID